MLVAVVSVKGSPGVTTLCLALAARWPAPARALVIEADPAGGDVAMRFALAPSPGLLSLAAAARRADLAADPGLVGRHAQALPGGLPVVAAPPDAARARGALSALAPQGGSGPLRAAAAHPGAVVLVDCGRVDTDSPAMAAVRAADVMVVLTRSGAADLAHLARRMPEIGSWSRRPVLLLAGRGHSTAAVARELGVTPIGRVPDDPRGAAVLGGRRSVLRWYHSGPARSLLGQTAHEIATVLAVGPLDRRPAGIPMDAPSAPAVGDRPESPARRARRGRFRSEGAAS